MADHYYCVTTSFLNQKGEVRPTIAAWLAKHAPSGRVVHEILQAPHPLAEQFAPPLQTVASVPLFRFRSYEDAEAFAVEHFLTVYCLEPPYVVRPAWPA